MKSRTATATAVAAGLTCAVEVAGAGFFGPLAGSAPYSAVGVGTRGVGKATPEDSNRWLTKAAGGAGQRGSRKGVAERLYQIRGGASGTESKFCAVGDGCGCYFILFLSVDYCTIIISMVLDVAPSQRPYDQGSISCVVLL